MPKHPIVEFKESFAGMVKQEEIRPRIPVSGEIHESMGIGYRIRTASARQPTGFTGPISNTPPCRPTFRRIK